MPLMDRHALFTLLRWLDYREKRAAYEAAFSAARGEVRHMARVNRDAARQTQAAACPVCFADCRDSSMVKYKNSAFPSSTVPILRNPTSHAFLPDLKCSCNLFPPSKL